MSFTQPVSMIITQAQRENLFTKLNELGYERYGGNWSYNTLATNYGKSDQYNVTGHESSKEYGRYFIEEYNEELFLALAAMTDEQYGIKGEWWICIRTNSDAFTVNKLYEANSPVNQAGAFLDNNGRNNGMSWQSLSYYRKATKEELIAHFSTQEEAKVMTQEQPNGMPNLKSGNIIETKEGTRGLIVQGADNELLIYWFITGRNSYTFLDTFDKNRIERIETGITRGTPSAGLPNVITVEHCNQKPIWTKPAPIVKLTLEEIAKKFNTEVKFLEIEGFEQ